MKSSQCCNEENIENKCLSKDNEVIGNIFMFILCVVVESAQIGNKLLSINDAQNIGPIIYLMR